MLLAKHAGQARQLGAPQALHTALLAAQALASPGQGFLFGSLDHSTAAQAAIDTIENISAHMETMSQQACLPDCHCAIFLSYECTERNLSLSACAMPARMLRSVT